jgi:hypothetical protein
VHDAAPTGARGKSSPFRRRFDVITGRIKLAAADVLADRSAKQVWLEGRPVTNPAETSIPDDFMPKRPQM